MPYCDPNVFENPNVYWSYCPSEAAAILFAILFGLTACVHVAQTIKYRRKNATIITTGAVLETTAFILRLVCIRQLDLYQVYEAQFILILIAPMWMNAFDFVLLGTLINYCLPDKKLCGIPARRVAAYFVALDIGTFVIQLAGAAITTSTDNNTILAGLHTYTAGVTLQQFFIFCFVGLTTIFYRRMKRECDEEKIRSVRFLLYTLYASLTLISFRVIFRIIEFSGSNTSKISTTIGNHEYFLYIFDSLPMFIALVIFNVTHPGKVLVGPDAEWPKQTKAERKAAKEAKKAAKQEKKREKAEEKNNGTREKVRRESSGTAILVDSSSTEDQIQPHTDAV